MSPVHEPPVGATVEWYTPGSLFHALGAQFDLDPAGAEQPTASDAYCGNVWTKATDGLSQEWFGHVWLNPPYGPAAVPFIDRMIAHADGLLLLPSRTETAAYQRCLAAADAVCLLRDRLWFVRSDDATGRSSFGSTLFAFGDWAADVLRRADLGWCAANGPALGLSGRRGAGGMSAESTCNCVQPCGMDHTRNADAELAAPCRPLKTADWCKEHDAPWSPFSGDCVEFRRMMWPER